MRRIMTAARRDDDLQGIRLLTTDDYRGHARLMAEAFSRGAIPQEPPADAKLLEFSKSSHYGVFEGDRLAAALTLHNIMLKWGGGVAPLGGVANVACAADRRGQGNVSRLLMRALIDMREAGQFLSGLFPFSFEFYRSHGWEWAGENRVTTAPLWLLPARPEARDVVCYAGADAQPYAGAVYAAFARRYVGMAARDETACPDFWKQSLSGEHGAAAYVHVYHSPQDKAPEGYLVFRYPSSGDKAVVKELLAVTPRAQRGLLGVLHNYGTQLKTVDLHHPLDDALLQSVMDWEIETKVHRAFMGRIVDVVAALESLDAPQSLILSVVISVDDPTCEWNNGTFELSAEAGIVSVRQSTKTADVALDIQALSQAYWGWPSLNMLRRADRLSVSSERGFGDLAILLPARCVYFTDFF